MTERRKHTSPLLYWAEARENIRVAKAAGVRPPWTKDPILSTYRFCNVRRRDDRVSQWFIHNVFNRNFSNRYTLVLVIALCRWVNWPPTIKHLLDEGLIGHDYVDLNSIGPAIDTLVQSDQKAWTGAYMVRASKEAPSKGVFVAETVVGALNQPDVLNRVMTGVESRSAEATWAALCSVKNWGSFMAGQVVADMTYTPLLAGAYDLHTWAPQGPGSKRGYNRLTYRPLNARIESSAWSERLQEWREDIIGVTGLKDITLHDVQNCLCETDKYIRTKRGEGRPRSTYKPETAF